MDYNILRAFVILAQELNYKRTATSLFISQSTLSKRVIALEAELGVHLFDRDTHSVRLTPEGDSFYRKAVELVRQTDRALDSVKKTDGEEAGSLLIDYDSKIDYTGFISSFILEAIQVFRKAHPLVKLNFEFKDFREMTNDIKNGTADLGFGLQFSDYLKSSFFKTSHIKVLSSVGLSLAVPGTLPPFMGPLSDLEGYLKDLKILAVNNGVITSIMSVLRELGLEIKTIQFCNSIQDVMIHIALGEGFCVLPENLLDDRKTKNIRLIPLKGETSVSIKSQSIAFWNPASSNRYIEPFVSAMHPKRREIHSIWCGCRRERTGL